MVSRQAVVTVAAGVAAVVALTVAGIVADREPPRDDGLAALLDEVVATGTPGALVLVEDESGSRRAAGGLADRDSSTPMRPDDRFRIGSITKTFVATVVLQLAASGALELDEPVERWLPGVVPDGITVRQLLAHRSGLFDYVNDPRAFERDISDPSELVALATSHEPLAAPGERYAYASTNYIVLGLLIERVTGTSLDEQLAQRIFSPLHLTRTTFEPAGASELSVRGYRAITHDGIVVGDLKQTTNARAGWTWASGAIVSDAPDVARFFGALLGGQLVPPRLLAQMVPERGYGLGLASFSTPCGTAVGHTGNVLGYVSVAWNARDGSKRVVLMTNSFPLRPETDKALHAVLDTAFCEGVAS